MHLPFHTLLPLRRFGQWFRALLLGLSVALPVQATTYYVSPTGSNSANGLTAATAWRTLAHACEQVPAGAHTIQLAACTYPETRPSSPRNGVTIAGAGATGSGATIITNAPSFVATHSVCGPHHYSAEGWDDYLIHIWNKRRVTVRDLQVRSTSRTQLLNGGFYIRDANEVELRNLVVRDFRWVGLFLVLSDSINFHHSLVENASLANDCNMWSGGLRSCFLSNSELHHLTIVSNVSDAYGYKAAGHQNVKIYDNVFDVKGEFAIESAFETEAGVNIYRNRFNRCLSLPKPAQGEDPNTKGFTYSFWVHDNYMTDSYGIEGPRNHLRISHNFFDIQKPGGRVYTQHGGSTTGPIWIDHNVVRNSSLGLVYARGQLENMHIDNNTVLGTPSGGWLIDVWDGAGMKNWTVNNNIFVGNADPGVNVPAADRRTGLNTFNSPDATKFAYRNNLVINCSNTAGLGNGSNFVDQAPGLRLSGALPAPYNLPALATADAGDFYRASAATSYIVDRGADVGLPFEGRAPDLGAYEWVAPVVTGANLPANVAGALFPNPARQEALVRSPVELATATITDGLGRSCGRAVRLNAREYRLDVGSLPAGMYLVQTRTVAGATRCYKLIVE